jgi:F-type H+-transporting ATPase subunit delta
MKNQVLVNKYAQGLVQAVGDKAEFRSVETELQAFLELLGESPELRKALLSPFLNGRKKTEILAEVLKRSAAGPKTVRFLRLLLEHKRLDIFADIAAALPEAWNEKLGILTIEVASAVALAVGQKERLRKGLEALEGKPVSLVYRIDPEIIGGLSLRKGHIVHDASVQGNLMKIKDIIQGA